MNKIEYRKLQIPNPKLQTNSKSQPRKNSKSLKVVISNLEVVWSLDFGAWDLKRGLPILVFSLWSIVFSLWSPLPAYAADPSSVKDLLEQNKAYEEKYLKFISQIEVQDKEIKTLSLKLAQAVEQNQKSTEEKQEALKSLKELEAFKEQAETQIKEYQDLKEKFTQMSAERDELAAERESFQKSEEALRAERDSAEQKFEAVKLKYEETIQRLEADNKARLSPEEVTKLKQDNAGAKKKMLDEILALQAKVKTLEAEVQSRLSLEETEALKADLEEAARLKTELEQIQSEYQNVSSQSFEQRQTIQSQSEKIKSMQTGLDEHAKELEVLLEKVRTAEAKSKKEIDDLKTRAEKYQTQILEQKAQIDFKEEELGRLKKRIEHLENHPLVKEKKDSGKADGARHVVSSAKAGNDKLGSASSKDGEISLLRKKYDLAITHYEAEVRKHQDAKLGLTQKKQELEKTLEILTKEFESFKKSTVAAEKARDEQIKTLQERSGPLQSALDQAMSDIRIRDKMVGDLKFAAISMEDKVRALEAASSEQQRKIQEMEESRDSEVSVLERENKDLLESVEKYRSLSMELQTARVNLEARLKSLEKYKSVQDKELKSLYQDVSQKVSPDSEAGKVIARKEREIEKLEKRMKQLEELHKKDRVTFLFNLGVVYAQQGLYNDARESFEKILEMNPRDVAVHYNLGLLYENNLGNLSKAVSHYEAFLALSKDVRRVRQVESWIESLKEGNRGSRESRVQSARNSFENLFLASTAT